MGPQVPAAHLVLHGGQLTRSIVFERGINEIRVLQVGQLGEVNGPRHGVDMYAEDRLVIDVVEQEEAVEELEVATKSPIGSTS